MGHSEAYQKRAEECRQMARLAPDANARATWQRLAERWSQCADLEQQAIAAAERASRGRQERMNVRPAAATHRDR
jgi:hypothetical protein